MFEINQILKSIFSKTGFHIIKRARVNGSTRFKINDLDYDVIIPSANYAPWLGDVDFIEIFSKIKNNTLVDIYRCYELWKLTEKIHQINNKAHFIEIGVWRGGTATVVGRKLSLLQSNSTLYLADTFTGVAKATTKDQFYKGGEHSDTSLEIVEEIVSANFKNYKILKGIFPEQTAHLINNDSVFGYCHIDVDVYESAKDIVDWIWDKMIINGIIVFDDYGFSACDGVTKYVNEQESKSDRIVLYNLNGHAIMMKIN